LPYRITRCELPFTPPPEHIKSSLKFKPATVHRFEGQPVPLSGPNYWPA
jgi:hypothetical protein